MLEGLNILVADDNPVNLKIIEAILRKQGASVTLTRNGQELVDVFSTGHFDIVLADLQMPVLDGYEAVRFIRRELNSQVPVLALSADIFAPRSEAFREAGINDYLSKPYTSAMLGEKILALTGRKPAVDLRYLYELYGNDASYNEEVIRVFVETVIPSLEKMKELIDAGPDYEELAMLAHQLRSSFSVIRIGDALDALTALELMAVNRDDRTTIHQVYVRVQTVFDKALPELRTLYK